MRNFQSRGFTLVEILVVLIITGFIVAILLQSLHQVFRLQTNFGSDCSRMATMKPVMISTTRISTRVKPRD